MNQIFGLGNGVSSISFVMDTAANLGLFIFPYLLFFLFTLSLNQYDILT